jgi:hypothetical protein
MLGVCYHPGRKVTNSGGSREFDRIDLYHGLFRWHTGGDGKPRLSRHALSPSSVPCPATGRQLKVATLEATARAICPSCANHGQGGFVSFVGDLRMAYACPE